MKSSALEHGLINELDKQMKMFRYYHKKKQQPTRMIVNCDFWHILKWPNMGSNHCESNIESNILLQLYVCKTHSLQVHGIQNAFDATFLCRILVRSSCSWYDHWSGFMSSPRLPDVSQRFSVYLNNCKCFSWLPMIFGDHVASRGIKAWDSAMPHQRNAYVIDICFFNYGNNDINTQRGEWLRGESMCCVRDRSNTHPTHNYMD